nr:hypothetical protein [Tanacetum cinerariifolium]
MDTTKAQQIALDDALIAPANRLKIRKCNHQLSFDLKSNEPTIQVLLDTLKLTPFYNAFQITANVPEIYMQEFWAIFSIHHTSLCFKMNDRSHTLNIENFKDMLQISPRLPGYKFKDLPFEEEILSFIRDLGHTREIKQMISRVDKESWGDSEDEDDNDDDDVEERAHTPSDYKFTNEEKLDVKESMDDEVIKELYDDVNVNLGNDDTEMTDANQGGSKQQNVYQESGFKQEEEEDAHVTLTLVPDTEKPDEPVQSSSFPHATAIPKMTSDFTTTTPPPPPFFNPLLQQQTPTITTPTFTTTTSTNPTVTLPEIPNFASVFKFNKRMKEVVNVDVQLQINKLREEAHAKNQEFLNQVDLTMKTIIKDQVEAQVSKIMPKIEKYVTESLGAEANKSINRSDTKKNLYNALVESYNFDTYINTSYGDVVLLKRGRDDQDKDEDPLTGSDQRTKEGNLVKMLSPPKIQEELSHTVEESSMQQDQEFVTRDNDEQLVDKEVTKADWFKKPERRIIAVTRLTIMKKYDYGHLEEIEVRRDDRQLYTFKEGDFKRLRLQDIGDMLLLLVQQKLTNLTIDEWSNLRNKTAYTSHLDPHGIIYVDQFKRKRLTGTDKLHKFSDGTLNDVRTALHDLATGIRMDYLPMRK